MRHAGPDADGRPGGDARFASGSSGHAVSPGRCGGPRPLRSYPWMMAARGVAKASSLLRLSRWPGWQRITYGTTAWRVSMGRRRVVESVNAALKGAFTDLGRGFMRVMGVTKMTVMLGFHAGRGQPRSHPELPRQARSTKRTGLPKSPRRREPPPGRDVGRRDRIVGPAARIADPIRGFGRSPMAAGIGASTGTISWRELSFWCPRRRSEVPSGMTNSAFRDKCPGQQGFEITGGCSIENIPWRSGIITKTSWLRKQHSPAEALTG
jgi:hypothetical protein